MPRTVLPLLLALTLCLACLAGCDRKKVAPPQRPAPVGVVRAELADAPLAVRGVGHVTAMRTVTVTPQVTGKLLAMHFAEGDWVREGQQLASIDPQPFQARVDEAVGTLGRDWAKADQSTRDYLRYRELIRKQVVSQEDFDQRKADFEAAWQQVKADQATLASARIDLGYCRILSPLEGVAGYQQVKPGNIVTANTTSLFTVNQVRPVFVRFSVTEGDLAQVRRHFGARPVPVSARVPKEEQDLKEFGTLTAIDNAVDVQTGMISLQARFDNKDLALWPGQFVNVTATLDVEQGRIVLPFDAVMNRQDGSFVYVVTEKSTAELRRVKTGRMVERTRIVVEEGLSPGETVISEGVVRVAPGGAVLVQGGAGQGGSGLDKPSEAGQAPDKPAGAGQGKGGGQ
ncbi:Multidrug resistance protein MdtA [Fundidesulfovibrio magnetotacticus]|uniref:Multidrug resistance protein MdtA n=1 Tax=Fundidesulfovibrio magnetotacticus TaxID=2730080 RepID=A0A6V8LVK0_9BACT|nr:efflux RND transporter periplasmic adaptor subunit [Fundidesulfovibrio magnetotacticus]GFK92275.1 Multidrug resistance protein MdtA [Fundidesulfovibrio magnetotacticus]